MENTRTEDSMARPVRLGELREVLNSTPGMLELIDDRQAGVKANPAVWSRKEELGHLIDSAANNHRRLVLAQIEDSPQLAAYDGEGWVIAQQYASRDWRSLIQLWRWSNQILLDAADAAPDSAWSRTLRIGDSEPVTLGFVLDDYVSHMNDHLAHVTVGFQEGSEMRSQAKTEKPAPVDHPIAPLLSRRWSTVAFDERPVERAKILTLLEAARWAPSCYNEQPWQYLVFGGPGNEDQDALLKARACLVSANAWATKAPVLMISIARENFARGGQNRWAQHDVGMASENLVLQAVELGLAAHQMAGFDADRARSEFSIPDGFTPMAMIAIGYPYTGSLDALDEKLRKRQSGPRARKPLSDVGLAARWGVPFYSD